MPDQSPSRRSSRNALIGFGIVMLPAALLALLKAAFRYVKLGKWKRAFRRRGEPRPALTGIPAEPIDDEPAPPSPLGLIAFLVILALAVIALLGLPPRLSSRVFAILFAGSMIVGLIAWVSSRPLLLRRIGRAGKAIGKRLSDAGVGPGRLIFFALFVILCAIILLTQRRETAVGLFAVLIGVSVALGLIARELEHATLRGLLRAMSKLNWGGGPAVVTPAAEAAARRVPWPLLVAEIAVVIVMGAAVTSHIVNLNPELQIPGHELEWLTSSVHFASTSLRDYGYIPLWQPYLEMGEPLIDNPFAFILNPITAGPSLIWGSVNGLKISILLSAIVAGLGGWVMGRVMGLSLPGRLLLAALMIGKGNMHAMFGTGYYQLAASQAYFPWIMAGVLATLRIQHRRWPIVLTAVAYTLQFWAGNIWYVLPMILCTVALAVVHAFGIWGRIVDGAALRRLALAGLLTVGLSAATLLPIWGNRDYIGGHPDLIRAGVAADPELVVQQFYDGDYDLYSTRDVPGERQFYYSFVSPLWFLFLIFILAPGNWSFRSQPGVPESGRIWLVAIVSIVFFTVWGIGGTPLMIWLYDHIELLGQWRFVGRALAVSSFWIAVIVALRVDGLWRFFTDPAARRRESPTLSVVTTALQAVLAGGLLLASAAAAVQVNAEWRVFAGLTRVSEHDDVCLTWLREEHPDDYLYVYRWGYDVITPFLDNRVRIHDIEADYFPFSLPFTLGHFDLTAGMPNYGLAWTQGERGWLTAYGYDLLTDSPNPVDENHCLYQRRESILDYAFVVTLQRLDDWRDLTPSDTTPASITDHKPDQITLSVSGPEQPSALVVQERAYPGWQVEIDGARATLESVGGLIGVRLPQDGQPHTVRFAYRPPLFYAGAALTLITWAACILYLLQADRRFRQWRARRGKNPG